MNLGTPILLYHRVAPLDGSPMDRFTVSPARFEAQMKYIAASNWRVVPLEKLAPICGRVEDQRELAITFDDGFASNREHAWPVLEKFMFSATTFLVTDELGGTNTWDDSSMPRYPLLEERHILDADPQLMSFQSHSLTHATLTGLDEEKLAGELIESKKRVGHLANNKAEFFAYPFGTWNPRVRHAVTVAGYKAALSCRQGLNSPRTDPFLLRRVEIREEDLGIRLRFKLNTGLGFS